MRRISLCVTLVVLIFVWVGCQTLPESVQYPRDDDRASITPGTPVAPTATELPPDFPTATPYPTDDRGSATPCDPDGCPQPSSTPLPSDWPTSTLNPDQIYLTALAGTPSQTPDIDDRATHAALEQTQEAQP